jgi:hypothetical protein
VFDAEKLARVAYDRAWMGRSSQGEATGK